MHIKAPLLLRQREGWVDCKCFDFYLVLTKCHIKKKKIINNKAHRISNNDFLYERIMSTVNRGKHFTWTSDTLSTTRICLSTNPVFYLH